MRIVDQLFNYNITMSSRMQCLWKQAMKTFSGQQSSNFKPCQKNLDKLWHLMNRIVAEDVGLCKQTLESVKSQLAPLCVIDIFGNEDFSISVFILKHGFTMPLHDHPGMHGFLKVISGTVQVNSFTLKKSDTHVTPNEEIAAVRHEPVIVDSTSPACILTPHKKNLHEIECIDGLCAFLDVLSPPYDVDAYGKGPRPCTYFRVVSSKMNSGSSDEIEDVQLLVLEDGPSDFSSTSLTYTGPPLT